MIMQVSRRIRLFLDYFIVFLFVLTSGSKLWIATLSPGIAFVFFLAASVAYKYTIGIRQNNDSLFFVYIVALIMVLGHLYYNRELKENSSIGYIVSLLASYWLISSFDFYQFRKILLDILFLITLVGIPIFILNEIGWLSIRYLNLGDGVYMYWGPYVLGWGSSDFHRYAGIWHEPGAGQIFLNIILLLHLDKFIILDFTKSDLFKFFVIILGLIISFSTGGYLVLIVFVVTWLFRLNIKSKFKLLISVSSVFLCVIILVIIYNSDVIQGKLFNDDSVSKIARTNDIKAFFEMFLNRPILGYGLGSTDFWNVSIRLGNTANSCGLLTFLAALGVLWLIAFIHYVYYGIEKFISIKLISMFFLLAFLMLQWNECYIEYPITNMFVFSFGSYQLK